MRHASLVALLLAVAAPRIDARTWHVNPDGSGATPTIQAAIDSAASGDTVLLAVGKYTWSSQQASGHSMIEMKSGVTLRSENGPESTVVDAERQGRVIWCVGTGSVRIEGVTIQNGDLGGSSGAGILANENIQLEVAKCVIRNNRTHESGAGIACVSGKIRDCEILENVSERGGSGAGIFGVDLEVSGCTFRNNSSFGDPGPSGGALRTITGLISDCLFVGNSVHGVFRARGGAVRIVESGTIKKCVFLSNEARIVIPFADRQAYGGAVAIEGCLISNSVFADNVAVGGGVPGAGGAIASTGLDTVIVSNCTLVRNRSEVNGTNSDPLLRRIGGVTIFAGLVRTTIIAWSTGAAVNSVLQTQCNNFWGNALGDSLRGAELGGNFSLDPLFCSVDSAGGYQPGLAANSPCAPGNHPDTESCGLIGTADVDCGPTAVNKRSWSNIKDLFR